MADALKKTIVVPHGLAIPYTPGITNFALDASNDSIGLSFKSETSDAITHIGFRYGARVGTPPTYKASFQGTDLTNGFPDGTIKGGGSPASVTFTPPADATWDGTYRWVALDNSYTPSIEDDLTIVVTYDSGTVDGSNHSTYTQDLTEFSVDFVAFPVPLKETAGSWAKTGRMSPLAYRTASNRYGLVYQSDYDQSYSTSGNREAMHFTLPAAWGDTFKIAGLIFNGGTTGSGTFKLGVWEGTATTHDEVTVDHDQRSTSRVSHVPFATRPALNYGTKYYIGTEATGTFCRFRGHNVSEANDRLAFTLGTNMGFSSFNGTSWTDDNTIIPWVGIVLADITEPAGGGGGGPLIGGRLIGR